MPFFKVDDRFHSHPKAIAAGPAAIGLWTVAGSWSCANLTDGFIPRHVLASITPAKNRETLAKRLVVVGLWEAIGGEGWQFHDWGDDGRQWTSEQIRGMRKANRERQARHREAVRNGVTNASVTPSVTPVVTAPQSITNPYNAGAVTDPAPEWRPRPVDNPSLNGQSSPAERHPSARPLAAAEAHAGIDPTAQPARGTAVEQWAAYARQAITEPERTDHARPD